VSAVKKIDFHIHTVSTVSDREFEFSINTLQSYVEQACLDAIAITNHNIFDKEQFLEIKSSVQAKVFPGIEIDVEGTHILLISEDNELGDFKSKCDQISMHIPDSCSSISLDTLREVFPDLSKYLLIPHYKKHPAIQSVTLERLGDLVYAGEVSGPKKFVHAIRDESSLVPLFFSDLRIEEQLKIFPSRQTFVDVGEITLESLKIAFKDRKKVFLSREDGHKFFNLLGNKLTLSTGLNVMLGERSTGKSYTLNLINDEFSTEDMNVKYIRQFSLLQKDEDDEREFSNRLKTSQARITEDYLKEFAVAVEGMKDVNRDKLDKALDKFMSSLLKHASESHRRDSFANAKLFTESAFSLNNLDSLKKMISSVVTIVENVEFQDIVDKHVSKESLRGLAVALILEYERQKENELKKSYINDIIEDIKEGLKLHTSATTISEIDLFDLMMDFKRIEKFNELCQHIKVEREFKRQEVSGFFKVARRSSFQNAKDVGAVLARKLSYASAFEFYHADGYSYLRELRKIDSLRETDYYKLFVKIDYEILNSNGFPVSGGERSEYRLLQEISDANEYDLLLIDEPESSFDNMFLFSRVNKLIKDLSGSMPVVLVTHNSTVGASIQPDFLVYTAREYVEGKVAYKLYTGHPGDKILKSRDGEVTKNHKVLLDCLEAGSEPYKERKERYEILKDR